jgi:outer membrane protein OmpA-like peptidoglycan-associated protein/invasion protein IalB
MRIIGRYLAATLIALLTFSFNIMPLDRAIAVPASTYHYEFEGNSTPLVGSPTLTYMPSCSTAPAGSPCNTSTSFGTSGDGDGYLAWSSSGSRGGGFKVETPNGQPIGTSYSMSLKFEFSNVSSYRKIVDYKNGANDDTGFYIISGRIQFYPLPTSTVVYSANQVLNLLAVRTATGPTTGTFTVYAKQGSTLTKIIDVADQTGSSIPVTNAGGGTVFGFFFDDMATSGEATSSGKIYDLKFWENTALTEAQITEVANAPATVTIPSTPDQPTVVAANQSVTVSVPAPTTGGSPDTYTVTAAPGGATCQIVTPSRSCTVTGLTNGTPYTFSATATNAAGTTSASVASASATPAPPVTPGAPGTPTASAGNAQATVTITAPTTGGTPTSYTVTASPGGATCTVTVPATSCTVTGLTNGTAYTFSSTATNGGGTSASSASSASVTPLAPPGTPGTPTAVAGANQATVTIVAPGSGGAPATYTVTASPGGATCTVTVPATSCVVTGLTGGTNYTFRATATNGAGTSSASASSAAVTPTSLAAPGTPGTPTVSPGDGQATITVVAPGSGGQPATYTVTASPGGATCTVTVPATSCVISGLSNGTAYTFTSTATNAAGTSSASGSSAAVTPASQTSSSGSTGANTIVNPRAVSKIEVEASNSKGKSVLKIAISDKEKSYSSEKVQIRLFDLSGKLLKTVSIEVEPATNSLELDLDLPIGTFNAEVNTASVNKVSDTVSLSGSLVEQSISSLKNQNMTKLKVGSPNAIYFDANSARLSKSAKQAIKSFISQQKVENKGLALSGFVSQWKLSNAQEKLLATRRAYAVGKYIQSLNVQGWIYYYGYSADFNKSKATDRRVDLRFIN